MQIVLNGSPRDISAATVAALLAALELGGQRIAVEINGRIVPRSQHGAHGLAAGDKVEIIHAVGGG